jgi:hypothetical protein
MLAQRIGGVSAILVGRLLDRLGLRVPEYHRIASLLRSSATAASSSARADGLDVMCIDPDEVMYLWHLDRVPAVLLAAAPEEIATAQKNGAAKSERMRSEVTLRHACGHTEIVPYRSIKGRQRKLEAELCAECRLARLENLKGLKAEVMALCAADRCSLRDAVEIVTGDPEMRTAAYEASRGQYKNFEHGNIRDQYRRIQCDRKIDSLPEVRATIQALDVVLDRDYASLLRARESYVAGRILPSAIGEAR